MDPATGSAWIEFVKNFSTVGFGGFTLTVLVLGYFGKWVYGRELVAQKALTDKANERGDFWQGRYLSDMDELKKKLARLEMT